MGELERIYEEARDYASAEQDKARAQIDQLSTDELKAAYLDMIAMTAYYTKLERTMSATPRLHFDAIKRCMTDIDAEEILRQADMAEEEGTQISGTARVKARALIELLRQVRAAFSG